MNTFLQSLRHILVATVLLMTACCGVYPALVWTLGHFLFPTQSNGSLIQDSTGAVRGSLWIGQNFLGPGYFHGRPSSAGAGYDGMNSGGSNLGPTSQKLRELLAQRVAEYRRQNGLGTNTLVPADAVMASGSGLDPHISPRNAELQAPRVATARKLPLEQVLAAIRQRTETPQFGLLGEPRVHVLQLNRDLDTQPLSSQAP